MEPMISDLYWSFIKEAKGLRGHDLHAYGTGEAFQSRFVGKDLIKVYEGGEYKTQFKKADLTELFPLVSSFKWPDNADSADCPKELAEEIKGLKGDFSASDEDLKYLIPLAIRIITFKNPDAKEPETVAIAPPPEADKLSVRERNYLDTLEFVRETAKEGARRHVYVTKRFLSEVKEIFQPEDWGLFRDQCQALGGYEEGNLVGYIKNKQGHYLTVHSPFKLQEYYFDGHGNRVFIIRGRDLPKGVNGLAPDDVLFVSFLSGSDHDKVNRKLKNMTLGVFSGITPIV